MSPTVVHAYYQFDWIHHHLGHPFWGFSVRVIPEDTKWAEKTQPDYGQHHPMNERPRMKNRRGEEEEERGGRGEGRGEEEEETGAGVTSQHLQALAALAEKQNFFYQQLYLAAHNHLELQFQVIWCPRLVSMSMCTCVCLHIHRHICIHKVLQKEKQRKQAEHQHTPLSASWLFMSRCHAMDVTPLLPWWTVYPNYFSVNNPSDHIMKNTVDVLECIFWVQSSYCHYFIVRV